MLVAAITGWIAFAGAMGNAFVYDDWPFIVNHPAVTRGPWYRAWSEPTWPRGVGSDKIYRPLTTLTYRLNVTAFGDTAPQARRFHAVNFALHALAAAGVALAAWRLSGRPGAAWVAGLLFAAHPVHTEAVVTGYGRSELLAGCFGAWLLASRLRPTQIGRPEIWRQIVQTLLFAAAVMSKENAVLLWPALAVIDAWHYRRLPAGQRPGVRAWFSRVVGPLHVGCALACAAFFALRCGVFGWVYTLPPESLSPWASPMSHAGPAERVFTPFRLLWLSAELLVRPSRLCPVWSVPTLSPANQAAPDVLAGMLLAAGLLAGVVLLWRRRALEGAVVAGLGITLSLPLHAIPVAHWLFAERWLYLPTVFLAVAIGSAVARGGMSAAVTAVAAAVALLPASWSYAVVFRDDLTLHQETVLRHPDSFQGNKNLAYILLLEDRPLEAARQASVLAERFGPLLEVHEILARCHLAMGDPREALEHLDSAIGGDPLQAVRFAPYRQQALEMIARQVPSTAPSTTPGQVP